MNRQDLFAEVIWKIDKPHARVIGADYRISIDAIELPGHSQRTIGISAVVSSHQLHPTTKNPAFTIQLFHSQLGSTPHITPVSTLVASQRRL